MANVINATSTGNGGLVSTGDDSGILNIQTNETTAITVDASQNTTFAGKVTSAGALTLASNGTTTAVTIDTSQNVGINNTSPVAKLDVENTSAKPFGTAAQLNAIFKGSVSVGEGGAIGFDYFGSHTNCPTSIGYAVESQAGSTKGSLVFGTRSVTTDTAPSERMRIDSSGRLLVGTTSAVSNARCIVSSDPSTGVDPMIVSNTRSGAATDYHIICYRNGSIVGSVQTTLSSTIYATSSDYRLKEDIQPMSGALSKVLQLKPVTYKWKLDGTESQGFIAHELQEVVPEAVCGQKDELDADGNPKYQGIDTSFLVATLTAAIQELKAINDTQAETINALTARIVALEGQ